MTEYKIQLTDVQEKAMKYITPDPQDWIYKTVETRVNAAIEEIVKKEMELALQENRLLAYASKDELVLNTKLKSAAERNEEFEKQLEEFYKQKTQDLK
jgi:hypothetical protein